jgi:hypothetical protein
MVEGNCTASVKAVNKMYLRSAPVTYGISVSPMLPHLTGKYLVAGKTNYIPQITIKGLRCTDLEFMDKVKSTVLLKARFVSQSFKCMGYFHYFIITVTVR